MLPRAWLRQVERNRFQLNWVSTSKLARQRFQLVLGTRNQYEVLFSSRECARETSTEAARRAGDNGKARSCFYLKLVRFVVRFDLLRRIFCHRKVAGVHSWGNES